MILFNRSHRLLLLKSGAILISMLLLLPGCETLMTLVPQQKGVYHTVSPGEDLWRISSVYKVDPKTIAEYNQIYNPDDIESGDKIFIPGARKVLEIPPPTPDELAAKVKRGLFIWPVNGMVFSLFGPRWGRFHWGIDISAPSGTSIVAAGPGDVVFVGRRGGYGITVEIRHDEHYTTVYAHMRKTMVEEGKRVKVGEVIGEVGCTGRCTGPHCHFEVLYDGTQRNPLFFLP
ncbi:MAG: M23 family metallopeptidase [Deltaproteobacteria bacterium]|uniref:M23 family metallopeptidase n=1 Tax=Candidatus Zymogenus saltonus TaxID=2844893 RepID=A0A9D8PPQ6_9DELT|nr:M23 family metallopeptidase [Candidatus Zymogenus saltonus]